MFGLCRSRSMACLLGCGFSYATEIALVLVTEWGTGNRYLGEVIGVGKRDTAFVTFTMDCFFMLDELCWDFG